MNHVVLSNHYCESSLGPITKSVCPVAHGLSKNNKCCRRRHRCCCCYDYWDYVMSLKRDQKANFRVGLIIEF